MTERKDLQHTHTAPTHRKRRKRRRRNPVMELLSWVVPIALAVVVALVVRTYVFEFVAVKGPSMQPGLETGEVLFVNKLVYQHHDPSAGEVVITGFPGFEDTFVKRVVGCPGDTLEIRQGVVYRNGQALAEPYVRYEKIEDVAAFTVPAGQYFVMGDNRANSTDSRIIGMVNRSLIRGKAQQVIWPLGRWEGIDHHAAQ